MVKSRDHIRLRASQRYGITLNKKLRREIERIIKDRKTEHGKILKAKKHTVSITIYRIKHETNEYVLLWSKTRQEILTFLPSENREKI